MQSTLQCRYPPITSSRDALTGCPTGPLGFVPSLYPTDAYYRQSVGGGYASLAASGYGYDPYAGIAAARAGPRCGMPPTCMPA